MRILRYVIVYGLERVMRISNRLMFQNTDVFAQERELLKVAGNFFDIVNHSVFTFNFFKAMGTHFVITFDSLTLAIFMARAANKIPPKYKKLLHLTSTN